MTDTLTTSALTRWRVNPVEFIEQVLIDPETGKPFVLLDAERWFLKFAFTTDENGRLLYPELIYGAIKKSGKTGFGALFVITILLLYGGRYAEAYVIANDLEQAQTSSSTSIPCSVIMVVFAPPGGAEVATTRPHTWRAAANIVAAPINCSEHRALAKVLAFASAPEAVNDPGHLYSPMSERDCPRQQHFISPHAVLCFWLFMSATIALIMALGRSVSLRGHAYGAEGHRLKAGSRS